MKQKVNKIFKVKFNGLNKIFKPKFEIIPTKEETSISKEENGTNGVDL